MQVGECLAGGADSRRVSLSTTIGTIAIRRGRQRWQDQPLQLGGLANQAKQGRVAQAVENIASLPPVSHHPGLTQRHQVLGEGGLAQAEHAFQVADTRFPCANAKQDFQARRRADDLQ